MAVVYLTKTKCHNKMPDIIFLLLNCLWTHYVPWDDCPTSFIDRIIIAFAHAHEPSMENCIQNIPHFQIFDSGRDEVKRVRLDSKRPHHHFHHNKKRLVYCICRKPLIVYMYFIRHKHTHRKHDKNKHRLRTINQDL